MSEKQICEMCGKSHSKKKGCAPIQFLSPGEAAAEILTNQGASVREVTETDLGDGKIGVTITLNTKPVLMGVLFDE